MGSRERSDGGVFVTIFLATCARARRGALSSPIAQLQWRDPVALLAHAVRARSLAMCDWARERMMSRDDPLDEWSPYLNIESVILCESARDGWEIGAHSACDRLVQIARRESHCLDDSAFCEAIGAAARDRWVEGCALICSAYARARGSVIAMAAAIEQIVDNEWRAGVVILRDLCRAGALDESACRNAITNHARMRSRDAFREFHSATRDWRVVAPLFSHCAQPREHSRKMNSRAI
ncbi:MAG: hypothetical protein M0R66_05405 [Candidatus Omnitrophica bacterium]|nr:hypothetical protein [Candidatus Omnitrophota bacterium]